MSVGATARDASSLACPAPANRSCSAALKVMRFVPTELPEVILVEPTIHGDTRGFFLEAFHAERYREGGIDVTFVQDNHSRSVGGTLRGLHAQLNPPQAKLVRVVRGEIWDVAVDVRRGSPTFGRWVGATLSDANLAMLYIPVGFVHGFCVTSDVADVEYKVSGYYDPAGEIGVRWDDPELAIPWPVVKPIISPRDAQAPRLADVWDRLPAYG